MSDAPDEIGLVGNGFEWRLWNRHEDSDEQGAVRYILRDKHEAEVAALKKQVEELTKVLNRKVDEKCAAVQARTRAEAEAAALRKALREDWHGVVLDGRNEHGSHVLMLPHRSIELEQDENGDFIKYLAETILQDAERLGFSIGDAVVATFDACTDEGFFSHYEYTGVSSLLTEHLYGPPEEQQSARAALSAVKEV